MRKWTFLAVLFAFLAMPFLLQAVQIPWSTWKGAADISFSGKCTDSKTGKAISVFSVQAWQLPAQTVKTVEGTYSLTIKAATSSGAKHLRNFRIERTFGRPVSLLVRSSGYQDRHIEIPGDEVLVGENNALDIRLDPAQ
jgi:hypothetical protein